MVRLSLDLRKKDFVWIGLVVVLFLVGSVVAQWNSAKTMFHDSEDVKITIGGVDYSLQEAVDGGLIGGTSDDFVLDGDDGYKKFSDGFIIQWGKAVTPEVVTFPIAFPNKVFSISIGHNNAPWYGYGNEMFVDQVTKSSARFTNRHQTSDSNEPLYWMAIGY